MSETADCVRGRGPLATVRAVVAYVRVSTSGQDLAMQEHAIRRVAAARGDEIAELYEEKASGRSIDRPELARLRQAVREGRVQRIYVWRLDRLTRSGIRDTLDVVHELDRNRCDLVTVSDGFELAGPARDVVLAVMAWAAEIERRAIGDRIRAGIARVEADGRKWGRPKRMDRATRARALEMSAKGSSVRDIAKALKVAKSTVSRELKAGRGPLSRQSAGDVRPSRT